MRVVRGPPTSVGGVTPRLSALVLLAFVAGGCSGGAGVDRQSLTVGVKTAPKPPRDALVLAAESGSRAVALAVQPRRLTATVLGSSGEPLSGLNLSFVVGSRLLRGRACGSGCYSAVAPRPGRVAVRPGGSR